MWQTKQNTKGTLLLIKADYQKAVASLESSFMRELQIYLLSTNNFVKKQKLTNNYK